MSTSFRPSYGRALALAPPLAQPASLFRPERLAWFQVVRHRLPSIAALTMAGVGVSLSYLALATPLYTAASAVFVDPRNRRVVADDVVQGAAPNDVALFESQVSIIGSDAILRRVVKSLALDRDPEFVPSAGGGLLLSLREAVTGPRRRVEDTTLAIEALAKKLRIRRAQNTYVVNVEATTTAPAKSAAVANAVLQAYLDDQVAAKAEAAIKANTMIDARLDELKAQLRSAETRADAFKRSNRIVTSEGGLLNEQQLTRLNTELVAVRAQVAQAKAKLDEMTATLKRGISPESLPEAMLSPVIQRLREQLAAAQSREAALASRLLPNHPSMADARAQTAAVRGAIAAELNRIADQARNEHQIATTREREIHKTLQASEQEVALTTTAQIRLRELEREADASREVLRAFLARSKETQEQSNVSIADARIITPAVVPSRASSPNVLLVLALGALAGLGLGLARALALPGSGDVRSRTPTSNMLLAKIARLVPTGREVRGGSRAPDLDDVLDALAPGGRGRTAFEAGVRRLAGRLRDLDAGNGPRVLALASSEPGAGVTTTALAIAYSEALNGTRTLLIDAASNEPTLSEAYASDIDQSRPCVLDSKAHLDELVSREPKSGLAFLPIAMADLRTLTPTQRTRLATGIGRLAADYDLVVIDAGATGVDTSAAALAGLATQMIAVGRNASGRGPDGRAIAHALALPEHKVAGVVLTAA
jgi:uncharacterized protein involved in exopolysaccharide biosynthesis